MSTYTKRGRNRPTSTVAIVNDGLKGYQILRKFGIQVVASYQDLRQIVWGDVKSLVIQPELNWANRRGSTLSTYEGYYLLIELLDRGISFSGTVGFITHQNSNIYNETNNRIYPFMLKTPPETIYTPENTLDFDKKILMNHYHTVFAHLQHEYDNGFIQFNTDNRYIEYHVECERERKIVYAKRIGQNRYTILKEKWWGLSTLEKAIEEHHITGYLRKVFSPVLKIKTIEIGTA